MFALFDVTEGQERKLIDIIDDEIYNVDEAVYKYYDSIRGMYVLCVRWDLWEHHVAEGTLDQI